MIQGDKPLAARKVVVAVFTFMGLVTALSRSPSAQELGGVGDSFGTIADLILPETTQLTLGVGFQHKPDYRGSDSYRTATTEVFFVRYKDLIKIDNTGASITLFRFVEDVSLGPVIRLEGGRKEQRNEALTGLGNIGSSWELGGFIKANFWDEAVARARFRWGVSGHEAFLMDLQISRILFAHDDWRPLLERDWTIVANLNSTYSGGTYAQKFFGITPEQAAASGQPAYSLGAGFRDFGGELAFRWEFSDQWSLIVSGKYNRLLGAFANSPLVAIDGSPDQWRVGAIVTYTFGVAELKGLFSKDSTSN